MKRLLFFIIIIASLSLSIQAQPIPPERIHPSLTLNLSQEQGVNISSVVWIPSHQTYRSINAGSASFFIEIFDKYGSYQAHYQGRYDFRGAWWNEKLGCVQANVFGNDAILLCNDNAQTRFSQTKVDIGSLDAQSCLFFNPDDNEFLAYTGEHYIKRFDGQTGELLCDLPLSNIPVEISHLNQTSGIYTGWKGYEIGLYDKLLGYIYWFDKLTGKYTGKTSTRFATQNDYRFAYANGYIWLYEEYKHQWKGYRLRKVSLRPTGQTTQTCKPNSFKPFPTFKQITTDPTYKCYGTPVSEYELHPCPNREINKCLGYYVKQDFCYEGHIFSLYYAENKCKCGCIKQTFESKHLDVLDLGPCDCPEDTIIGVEDESEY